MTVEVLSELSRDEKLLVLTAMEVEVLESSFSGHNTRWTENIDLVLHGRKGLLDYSDEELDAELESELELLNELESNLKLLDESGVSGRTGLVQWARKLSRIDHVSSVRREWGIVSPEEQQAWDKEEGR